MLTADLNSNEVKVKLDTIADKHGLSLIDTYCINTNDKMVTEYQAQPMEVFVAVFTAQDDKAQKWNITWHDGEYNYLRIRNKNNEQTYGIDIESVADTKPYELSQILDWADERIRLSAIKIGFIRLLKSADDALSDFDSIDFSNINELEE